MGSEPKEIVLKMAVSKLVGYWNLSLCPLEEQAVLLTTGFFSPAPLLCFFKSFSCLSRIPGSHG